jgi:hypothetical protein
MMTEDDVAKSPIDECPGASTVICVNPYKVQGDGARPPAVFKIIELDLKIDGLTIAVLSDMPLAQRDALTTSTIEAASEALGVPITQITVEYRTAPSGRRLAEGGAPVLLAVIVITVPAADANVVVAAIETELPSAAAAASIFLPAIAAGFAALPASEGGASAVELAATFAITTSPVTAPPVDYTAETYKKKEAKRLNKRCRNKKPWCDSVTLSSGKGKCESYCHGGKCKAARKVKKSCKKRCKKNCRKFVLTPYYVPGR